MAALVYRCGTPLQREWGSGREDPVAEVAVGALGPLLAGDGVADVVLPLAVDLQVAHGNAFVAQVELLGHAPAGTVAGNDGDLQPVQSQLLEREAEQHHDSFGDVAVAGQGFVDPVAPLGVLERAALDARQVDLPAETATDEDAKA